MNWRLFVGAAALLLGLAACDGGESGTEPLTCGDGTTLCGNACSDTGSDPRNCGGCGIACGEGEVCSAGECSLVCPTGQQACDGACVTVDTSAQHCGACGVACAAGEACSGGACVANCPEGQTACNGGCFDTDTSRQHCGACGVVCGAGEACVEGACEPTCPAGQELCNGFCYDTNDSSENCGGCGIACGTGEVCVAGLCEANCADGLTECDGTCRNTDTDPRNCGACGNSCGDGSICVDGSCQDFCVGGLTSCDGACRDTENDRNHCGACGNACASTEICSEGACVTSCAGYASDLCDTGCTNFDTDPLNCGGCGNACDAGEVCSEGVCTGVCAPTLTECQDGACTSLQDDPNNCGACGTVCTAAAGALPVCSEGSCASACAPGQGDCNGDLQASGGNGCEVTFATDLDNCGACGITCPVPPNATRACDQGVCGVGTCQTGFANCDGDDFNGCEIDIRTDDANCGGCGVACNIDQYCSAGACQPLVNVDTCATAMPLQSGSNVVRWFALDQDYITTRPCTTTGNPNGPDLVFSYTPTYTGQAQVQFNNSVRAYSVVTEGTCGDLTTPLACDSVVSRVTNQFPVTANTTYFIHVVDSTSGTAELPNPLTVTVTDLDCATLAPTATVLSPANGGSSPTVTGTFQVTFSHSMDKTLGTFNLNGSLGTIRNFAADNAAVTWSSDGRTATIEAGNFRAGEVVTITWTGIEDAVCGKSVPASPWTVNMPVPPCTPGQGGVVGTTMTRIPLPFMPGSTFTDEYYIVADDSPTGWVYIGGTSKLYRVRKDGTGLPEDLYGRNGISSSHLGYDMTFAGQNLLALKLKYGGTDGHVFRLSADGGVTFAPEDVVTFPSIVGSIGGGGSGTANLHGLGSYGNEIFMVTFDSPGETEVWMADLSGDIPAQATLVTTFAGDTNGWQFCGGATGDARYIYTTCRHGGPNSPYTIVRIDRTTGALHGVGSVGLDDQLMGSPIVAVDLNADGIADVLYQKGEQENARYVCTPNGTPYIDELVRYGDSTGDGLGYDKALNAVWLYDDDTFELIKVQ